MIKYLTLLGLLALVHASAISQRKIAKKILVFSATKGFRHQSIGAGKTALLKLGTEKGIGVDTTEQSDWFTPEKLKEYSAIVFLSTTGDVLNQQQQEAFQQYINQGGGFAGIHSATDTEYGWPWFNRLVGAQFASHPKNQDADLHVVDKRFMATKHLPNVWRRYDEWYNFKNYYWDSMNVVLTIDEKSYTGGKNGDYHPMAWYHKFDGGRSFYTALGHTDESFVEPKFLQHLWGGIRYAMGYKR